MTTVGEFLEKIMLYGLEYFKVYHGVYRGLVTRVDDPEERSRVQAYVPQVGQAKAPDVWIKPSMNGSGLQRGSFWPPEVGDTVYVSFANGDPSRPEFYLGGWYGYQNNTSDAPSEFAYVNGIPVARGFVTRMGHSLVFSDEDGNERIELRWHRAAAGDPARTTGQLSADRATGDAASLTFKPDGSVELTDINASKVTLSGDGRKIEIKDVNTNSILMDSTGIRIQDANGNSITMAAAGITIDGASINLGEGADSPAMRHIDWSTWESAHIHPTGVGPSGPAVPPPTPPIASRVVKLK